MDDMFRYKLSCYCWFVVLRSNKYPYEDLCIIKFNNYNKAFEFAENSKFNYFIYKSIRYRQAFYYD